MSTPNLYAYIAGLPTGIPSRAVEDDAELFAAVDTDELPTGIVTGSNLLQFADETSPTIRSAVALSMLIAQRVASNDTVIVSPDEWIDRHNVVLKNLNWLIEGGGLVDAEFDDVGVAVHKAIIPFLTAALGPAAQAASLIIKALEQLESMSEDTPWIALFERESRRFDVSEYQFSYVDIEGEDAVLRMAAARLDARYGRTQVLFFKVSQEAAKFKAASSKMRASNGLLEQMNAALKSKLADQTNLFIQSLELGD